MPTTGLDIIDTAVKIGLGSIITAIASFLVTKKNHANEKQKARIHRERELLEKVAEEFEAFSHSVFSYWAIITEWNRYKLAEKDIPDDRKDALAGAKREYFIAAKGLTSAEAKLLLMGNSEAQKSLREYADLMREFRRKVFERSAPYKEEELQEWREKILLSRQKFFEALSATFSQL
jgi:hypothetical protein